VQNIVVQVVRFVTIHQMEPPIVDLPEMLAEANVALPVQRTDASSDGIAYC